MVERLALRYRLIVLLTVFLLFRVASRPVGGDSDWTIGRLPTIDPDEAIVSNQLAPWDHDRASHGNAGSLVPPTHWFDSPSVSSSSTVEMPRTGSNNGEQGSVPGTGLNHGEQSSVPHQAETPSIQIPDWPFFDDETSPGVSPRPDQAFLYQSESSSGINHQGHLDLPPEADTTSGMLNDWATSQQGTLQSVWQGSGQLAHQVPRQDSNLLSDAIPHTPIPHMPRRAVRHLLSYAIPYTPPQAETVSGQWSGWQPSPVEMGQSFGAKAGASFHSEPQSSSGLHSFGAVGREYETEGLSRRFDDLGVFLQGPRPSLAALLQGPRPSLAALLQEPRPLGAASVTRAADLRVAMPPWSEHETPLDLYRFLALFRGSIVEHNRWEQAIKNALGMDALRILPVDVRDKLKELVYIGQDRQTVSGYYHKTPFPLGYTPNRHLSHFLSGFKDVRIEVPRNIDKGEAFQRIYIYLNSRSNLDFINREYFLNQMQFLPINQNLLDWTTLNALYTRHAIWFVLPPRSLHGLPLIMMRHDGPKTNNRSFVQRLTGDTESTQMVSLWSPILKFDGKYTIVLHGVGNLDTPQREAVQQHLKLLHDLYPSQFYSSFYDLSKALP